jgi:hypothetical protein
MATKFRLAREAVEAKFAQARVELELTCLGEKNVETEARKLIVELREAKSRCLCGHPVPQEGNGFCRAIHEAAKRRLWEPALKAAKLTEEDCRAAVRDEWTKLRAIRSNA